MSLVFDVVSVGISALPKHKRKALRKTFKAIVIYLIDVAATLLFALALAACNVTRTVTTTSSTMHRGDTTVIIQSKTIESYDITKRTL